MAYKYAIVLAEPCSPLAKYYPGAGNIFLAAARISAAAGGPEHLQRLERYIRFAFEIDSYGMNVMNCIINCYANQPSREALDFWLRNGGPHASTALVSSTGQLAPEGETLRLLNVPGAESREFQIAMHFVLNSLAMATPGASTEYIETAAFLRLQSQRDALAETHGEEEAGRIITQILNREIDYLETGSFDPTAAVMAQRIKSAFVSGAI